MSRLTLHDCPDHTGCTIIRSDGPADDTHIRGDVLPLLNPSYPHYDYRAGRDGTTEVWGVPAIPALSPLAGQRAVFVATLAAADAGKVTLSAPDRAGMEVAIAYIDDKLNRP